MCHSFQAYPLPALSSPSSAQPSTSHHFSALTARSALPRFHSLSFPAAQNFNWVLGFDCNLPRAVHYLADNEREEIFYPAGHLGLLFSHIDHEQALLQGHRNAIVTTASSVDKRWLATADRGVDEVTIVWDTVSGEPVRTWFDDEMNSVGHLAFSADGTLLAVLSGEQQCQLTVWEWSSGSPEPLCEVSLHRAQGVPRGLVFHPDSNRQLVVTRDHQVDIVRWAGVGDSAEIVSLSANGVSAGKLGVFEQSVVFARTTHAATVTRGGYVVQWEMADKGACLKCIKIFDTTITCASMTPDGKTIVVGGRCGTVKYVCAHRAC
jgi:WD40 repeat protein